MTYYASHEKPKRKRHQYKNWLQMILMGVITIAAITTAAMYKHYETEMKSALAQGHYYQGLDYTRVDNFDAAIEEFNRAIQLTKAPSVLSWYYLDRAYAYNETGQHELALADTDRSFQINPQIANIYLLRGIIYYDLGDYDTSIANSNRAIQLNPYGNYNYNNRGFTYNAMREYDLALADFNQELELNPNSAYAYNNRGYAYFHLGDVERALADHHRSELLDPDNAYLYRYRAEVYYSLGVEGYERALADYHTYERLTGELDLLMVERITEMEAALDG